jgi:hypothetical protein
MPEIAGEVTIRQAVELGYKVENTRRKFSKLGDMVAMSNGEFRILASILSTEDMDLLGFRFPFERHGQWGYADCYRIMKLSYSARLSAVGAEA